MKENSLLKDENGSVIVLAMVILIVLTLLGISATTTSNIEVQIAGNEARYKLAFYGAEAGRNYVVRTIGLYSSGNITKGAPHYFPNNSSPYVADTDLPLPTAQAIDDSQSFNGSVEYDYSSNVPRGSGYAAGKFKAHRYILITNGYSLWNAESQIEVGFYRIGF
jgi:hypothetical protein